jgi:TldD protein
VVRRLGIGVFLVQSLLGAPVMGAQQTAAPSPALAAMQMELARSMAGLKARPSPPYFLSYEVTDRRSMSVAGAYGTITSVGDDRQRVLNIDLRVGTPAFDNTHPLGGVGLFDQADRMSTTEVPLEDNPLAIRRTLWYNTDRAYKRAVERLANTKTGAQMSVAPEDSSGDFAAEPAAHYVEAVATVTGDPAVWQRKIRAYTAPFARFGDVYAGEAQISAEGQTRWYVNSDGTELQTATTYYRLFIYAYTKAADGMVLPRYESFVAPTLA